jgi:membrane-bound serine protease (ClpP class)
VLSVSGIGIGTAMVFKHDSTMGLYTLLAVGIALPAVGGILLHLWPRTPFGRRMFLPPADPNETIASFPVMQELEALRGRFGRSLSALRPAGVVDFEGRRVDALTEGMMVEPGQWVRCVDVQGGKVIVRAVDKPNLGELETAIFS